MPTLRSVNSKRDHANTGSGRLCKMTCLPAAAARCRCQRWCRWGWSTRCCASRPGGRTPPHSGHFRPAPPVCRHQGSLGGHLPILLTRLGLGLSVIVSFPSGRQSRWLAPTSMDHKAARPPQERRPICTPYRHSCACALQGFFTTQALDMWGFRKLSKDAPARHPPLMRGPPPARRRSPAGAAPPTPL